MIPKVIHYCWFGGNELPELSKKCISSWKKFFPDYEIKEWNENNFNLLCCDYVKEAYEEKKWAFVSDYARFWILYNYGGIYFDTDVEVINDMTSIISQGSFMGCETIGKCAPGLGLGAEKGLTIYKDILDYYNNIHFRREDGKLFTVVDYTTTILSKHGWKGSDKVTSLNGINIYPPEYFCPYSYSTGKWNITENTVSIHHYAATWHTWLDDIILKIERCDKDRNSVEFRTRRVLSFPFRVIHKVKKLGIKKTIKFIEAKYK